MSDPSNPRRSPFGRPSEPYVLATAWQKRGYLAYYVVVLLAIAWLGRSVVMKARPPSPAPDEQPTAAVALNGGPAGDTSPVGRSVPILRGGGGSGVARGGPGGAGGGSSGSGGAGGVGADAGAVEEEVGDRTGAEIPTVTKRDADRERRYTDAELMVLVILFGAMGGTLHGLSSLARHAGAARLHANWNIFYYTRPLVGGLTALVVYMVVRGGLGGLSLENDRRGEFAAMGWAALAGLFSAPAMDKLRDVFDTLLRPTAPGGPPKAPPTTKPGPGPAAPGPTGVQPPVAPLAPSPKAPKSPGSDNP